MRSFKNEEAIRRVQEASFRGESPDVMKSLYIAQNTFDIGLDDPIFRIFQLQYLQKDISENVLTLTKAHPDTWGDPLENPLLKASYADAETGGAISLHGVLDFHALSWTRSPNESRQAWDAFSHNQPAIRIATTPRQLLERLMSVEDQWFMLRYHIGLVNYEDKEAIEKWVTEPDFGVHLDSLGQALACSLMRLRTCFEQEEEVRLLFSKNENPGCEWARSNIRIFEQLVVVPFTWSGAINSIIFSSTVSANERLAFQAILNRSGVSCPVSVSKY